MRLFWSLVSVVGLLLAIFSGGSPGLMGLGVLITFVGMLCAVFAFAAARIESTSRPDTVLLSPEVLSSIRAKARQQAGAAAPGGAPAVSDPRS